MRWLFKSTFEGDLNDAQAGRSQHLGGAFKTSFDQPLGRSGLVASVKLAFERGEAAMAHLRESIQGQAVAKVGLHDSR
jgi:hypothetical protein